MNDIPESALHDLYQGRLEIARAYGVVIPMDDFEYIDGEWTLDGMDPYEWAEAMYGEQED